MKRLPSTLLSLFVASVMPVTASAAAASAAAASAAAPASDFPTTTRVEYVLECMKAHPGKNYESFYKCSCAIDEIAKQTVFNEYAEISTASKYLRLGGERGAEFRDPEQVKMMAKKYKDIETRAADACFLK